jgi:8-oxo-dGTP diphosphatase
VNPSDRSDDCEPIVQAGIGLIARGGKFLVRMRPPGTVYAGFWEFPGGKCEPGELPADAVLRECLEETGLRVTVGKLRHRTRYRYPHGLVDLHFYDCVPEGESVEPATETGFRWVRAEALADLRFPEANEAVVAELATPAPL